MNNTAIFLTGLVVLCSWFAGLYVLQSRVPQPPSTFSAKCPTPGEFETLVVFINRDVHGTVTGSCAAVATAAPNKGRH